MEAEISCEMAKDLFKLAHEYQLESLKKDCEELLTRDIEVANVIEKIHLANTFEAIQLRKACLSFVSKNIDQVFMTQNIYELDRETLIELYKTKV